MEGIKCHICGEMLGELCVVGHNLWKETCGERYSEDTYKKYCEHIRNCEECKKGLELTDEMIAIQKEIEYGKLSKR